MEWRTVELSLEAFPPEKALALVSILCVVPRPYWTGTKSLAGALILLQPG